MRSSFDCVRGDHRAYLAVPAQAHVFDELRLRKAPDFVPEFVDLHTHDECFTNAKAPTAHCRLWCTRRTGYSG